MFVIELNVERPFLGKNVSNSYIQHNMPTEYCKYKYGVVRQHSSYSDLLQTGRSRDRIPWGRRFSAPVQTGSEAHPASYTTGTGSFAGVKRPGHGVDHPPPSSTKVTDRIELYFYFPSGPSWPVLG